MGTRWQHASASRGDDYDARWSHLISAGVNVHGEADLIDSLLGKSGGRRVLDAGCGTGRVGIELARRGYPVVGVDADPSMLDCARAKAPEIRWLTADLSDLASTLTEAFDLVALPGNVMIFLEPGTERRVVAQVAERLAPGGLLVAGFSLREDLLPLDRYDAFAAEAGLTLLDRWATWEREPFADGDYAVSVHRRLVAGSVP